MGQEIVNALKHVRPGNGYEFKGELFDKVTNPDVGISRKAIFCVNCVKSKKQSNQCQDPRESSLAICVVV